MTRSLIQVRPDVREQLHLVVVAVGDRHGLHVRDAPARRRSRRSIIALRQFVRRMPSAEGKKTPIGDRDSRRRATNAAITRIGGDDGTTQRGVTRDDRGRAHVLSRHQPPRRAYRAMRTTSCGGCGRITIGGRHEEGRLAIVRTHSRSARARPAAVPLIHQHRYGDRTRLCNGRVRPTKCPMVLLCASLCLHLCIRLGEFSSFV